MRGLKYENTCEQKNEEERNPTQTNKPKSGGKSRQTKGFDGIYVPLIDAKDLIAIGTRKGHAWRR
jgi:hypothetical protein